MCFVDLEKAFDRVLRKVIEWALRKTGLPERMMRAVMSLYEDAKTKVEVGTVHSDEFSVKVGVHQGSAITTSVCNCDDCCYGGCKRRFVGRNFIC